MYFLLFLHREGNDNGVFTLKESWDDQWLTTALELEPDWNIDIITASDFISGACAGQGFKKILYNSSDHHEVIPQLITLAGVLDAVPLDTHTKMQEIPSWNNNEVVISYTGLKT